MVNATPEFAHPRAVADSASEVIVIAFGPERGAHARSAVGMESLPFAIAVEIEGIFALAS